MVDSEDDDRVVYECVRALYHERLYATLPHLLEKLQMWNYLAIFLTVGNTGLEPYAKNGLVIDYIREEPYLRLDDCSDCSNLVDVDDDNNVYPYVWWKALDLYLEDLALQAIANIQRMDIKREFSKKAMKEMMSMDHPKDLWQLANNLQRDLPQFQQATLGEILHLLHLALKQKLIVTEGFVFSQTLLGMLDMMDKGCVNVAKPTPCTFPRHDFSALRHNTKSRTAAGIVHSSKTPIECGTEVQRCCSGGMEKAPPIISLTELKEHIEKVLALNRNAVLLSQLKCKILEYSGVSLNPVTFGHTKLSDLLKEKCSDVCQLFRHGGRHVVVHSLDYVQQQGAVPLVSNPNSRSNLKAKRAVMPNSNNMGHVDVNAYMQQMSYQQVAYNSMDPLALEADFMMEPYRMPTGCLPPPNSHYLPSRNKQLVNMNCNRAMFGARNRVDYPPLLEATERSMLGPVPMRKDRRAWTTSAAGVSVPSAPPGFDDLPTTIPDYWTSEERTAPPPPLPPPGVLPGVPSPPPANTPAMHPSVPTSMHTGVYMKGNVGTKVQHSVFGQRLLYEKPLNAFECDES